MQPKKKKSDDDLELIAFKADKKTIIAIEKLCTARSESPGMLGASRSQVIRESLQKCADQLGGSK